ncbi:MAG: hypothetical protein A4E74_01521 [Syntrophus sp. PtaB.Bin075]|nr:MAG: hypothetical protein A4E74_01521 [Syntrophus sp. PtaB.Bin075]
MISRALLLSISPKFVIRILQHSKTVELRRVRPNVKDGDVVLIYASSPDKALQAMAIIDNVTCDHPKQLWNKFRNKAGVNYEEFCNYFDGATIGYAIEFRNLEQFTSPIPLSTLRTIRPGFHPPQSYQYFTKAEIKPILNIAFSNPSA